MQQRYILPLLLFLAVVFRAAGTKASQTIHQRTSIGPMLLDGEALARRRRRKQPPRTIVRAIWELVGRFNPEAFYAEVELVEGVAGRPVWDPRLLISLQIFAYVGGGELGAGQQYGP